MRRYNDYELIYMYRSENCELALNILITKYHPLINKIIYLYGNNSLYKEDYVQEGAITIYNSLLSFKEQYNKTFTKYFELLFKRRIMLLQKKTHKYELHEEFHVYADKRTETIDIEILNDFEKIVFKRHFIKNQTIKFIAKSENKSVKQIYNTIYHIRNKMKNNML